MRVADRYIGWQVFFGTVLGVTMLTLVLVLGQVFKEVRHLLVEQGAPPMVLIKFIILVLPSTFMFTLPWGFLVATLLCFGRLSANNELIGLRMAGLSLRRIALPVMAVALFFSSLCYWINGTISPSAKGRSRSLISDLVMENPRAFLQPGVVQARLKDQRVYVERQNEDETLSGLHIYFLSDDTSRNAKATAYIHAGTADLTHDPETNKLGAILKEAFIVSANREGIPEIVQAAEAKPWFFDLSALSKKFIKPSYLTNREIPGVREGVLDRSRELDRTLRNPDLSPSERERMMLEQKSATSLAKSLSIEREKRAAMSFACLAFAMVGVPLGISARRRETSTGLILSLVIAVAYFCMTLFMNQFMDASRSVLLTLIWLPNLTCLLLGIWLFRRASAR